VISPRGIKVGGNTLGGSLLFVLIIFWRRMDIILSGLLYFVAADVLCMVCVFMANRLSKSSMGKEASADRVLRTKGEGLLLASCQISILGAMNISSTTWPRSLIHLSIDYLLVAAFFISEYRLLSVADSAQQLGGYIPFNFMGYPRSRRFLFLVFGGYCTICPLAIISLEFSAGTGGWRPPEFQSSQACLLMAAVISSICAGLMAHRYRRGMKLDKGLRTKVFLAAVMFLACTAVAQQALSYGLYTYILSAVAVGGIVTGLFSVWTVGQGNSGDMIPITWQMPG
jgi:hypothetical protein